MAKSKEQLENEINGTIYFSIKGDNTEALRKTELYKLSALVFEYCNKYMYAREKASDYGLEIHKCTMSCLKIFIAEKGIPFLHYLKAALSKSIKKAERREKDITNKVEQDYIHVKEGSECSLIDIQSSPFPAPDEELVTKETIITGLEIIEDVFKSKQERIKPYLRKLVTREFFEAITHFTGRYSFVDIEMVKNARFNKDSLPSQKEIAEMFGRHEADASRTINKFIKEVKEKSREKC